MSATTLLPSQSTTERATSASITPSVTVSSLPSQTAVVQTATASPVGPNECIIRSRLHVRLGYHGHQLITIYAHYRADGVTVLTFALPTKNGEQVAQVWQYADGDGIRVRSHEHPENWHTVQEQHCTCFGFLTKKHCYHQEMASEAMDVAAKWRYVRARGPWGE